MTPLYGIACSVFLEYFDYELLSLGKSFAKMSCLHDIIGKVPSKHRASWPEGTNHSTCLTLRTKPHTAKGAHSINIRIRPIPIKPRRRNPQPPRTTLQPPPTRIHEWTNPLIRHLPSLQLIAPPQKRRSPQARRLEIDIHILPVALIGFVDLVIDPDHIVLLDRLLPPEPRGAMDGAVGERVQVVDAAPVAYEDELHGAALVFALPAGLAEDCLRKALCQSLTLFSVVES